MAVKKARIGNAMLNLAIRYFFQKIVHTVIPQRLIHEKVSVLGTAPKILASPPIEESPWSIETEEYLLCWADKKKKQKKE